MDLTTPQPLRTVQLDKKRLVLHLAQAGIPPENVSLTHELDRLEERIVLKLVEMLVGKRIVLQTVHINTPATAWDHFKMDWFPRWLVRWFPVRMNERAIEREIWRVCPHFEVGSRDKRHLEFLIEPTLPLDPGRR